MLFLLLFGICCSSNDDVETDENQENTVQGTIRLTGDETSEFGTSLAVGNIEVANTVLTGTDKSVVLLSENITVENNELVFDESDLNGFVIVAADFTTGGSPDIEKTISMNITSDGEEFLYACSSPFRNFFIACGEGYQVDFEAKTVTFEGTTVINTENDIVLTMDGVITWN
ncbi:hypothetical protein [Flagellimonas flava]